MHDKDVLRSELEKDQGTGSELIGRLKLYVIAGRHSTQAMKELLADKALTTWNRTTLQRSCHYFLRSQLTDEQIYTLGSLENLSHKIFAQYEGQDWVSLVRI